MLLILYRHALRVYITTIHRQFGLKPNIIYILYASHRGLNFNDYFSKSLERDLSNGINKVFMATYKN